MMSPLVKQAKYLSLSSKLYQHVLRKKHASKGDTMETCRHGNVLPWKRVVMDTLLWD
jgi:hypothetical protein